MYATNTLNSKIEQLTDDYLDSRSKIGLVVAVSQAGQTYIKGFGQTSSAASVPPDQTTLFEIGSITKVFTGILLARLNLEGLVELDDPIGPYLPSTTIVPEPVQAITLRQLATHTAGLPRLPANALEGDPYNPYVSYKSSHLYAALEQMQLLSLPGHYYEYSNLGMGLLGHLLELKTEESYETLVKRLICQPLGMKDTGITLSPEQQHRTIAGYRPEYSQDGAFIDWVPTPHWQAGVLAGCYGLQSTASDLLKFATATIGNAEGKLAEAIDRSCEKHTGYWLEDIGLGWNIQHTSEGWTFHWHNGGTGGFVSFYGVNRAKQVGVGLLSNYGEATVGDLSLTRMGMTLLRYASQLSLELESSF
jgi:CubicO group peptidase (beta-lactamase class C family)